MHEILNFVLDANGRAWDRGWRAHVRQPGGGRGPALLEADIYTVPDASTSMVTRSASCWSKAASRWQMDGPGSRTTKTADPRCCRTSSSRVRLSHPAAREISNVLAIPADIDDARRRWSGQFHLAAPPRPRRRRSSFVPTTGSPAPMAGARLYRREGSLGPRTSSSSRTRRRALGSHGCPEGARDRVQRRSSAKIVFRGGAADDRRGHRPTGSQADVVEIANLTPACRSARRTGAGLIGSRP